MYLYFHAVIISYVVVIDIATTQNAVIFGKSVHVQGKITTAPPMKNPQKNI